MSGYNRKWASYELLRNSLKTRREHEKFENFRGIGIAQAYQGNGFFYINEINEKERPSVELILDKDGRLEIKTSMAGTDNETVLIWRRVTAELLSLDIDDVSAGPNSTGQVPDSGPACLSRNITVITRLIESAAAAIRKQRFRDPLPIVVRRSLSQSKALNWNNAPVDQNVLAHPGRAAAVVEVEIDPITSAPIVRGMWLAVDGGKIFSEERAVASLKFSMIHALNWASREELAYDDGAIARDGMIRYNLPRLQDFPPMEIDFLWSDTLIPKGIGDLPYSVIPAAYAQAVSQALDHSFEELPITAKSIWKSRQPVPRLTQ
jgi:CO/xanthine dehydrogenase Mo-binding subunit